MSALNFLPWLWAQQGIAGLPQRLRGAMAWLFVFGEPNFTIPGNTPLSGDSAGLITWLKVVSLFCLLGWVASWVAAALKDRAAGPGAGSTSPRWSPWWAAWARWCSACSKRPERIPVYKLPGRGPTRSRPRRSCSGGHPLPLGRGGALDTIRRLGKTLRRPRPRRDPPGALARDGRSGWLIAPPTTTLLAGTVTQARSLVGRPDLRHPAERHVHGLRRPAQGRLRR